MSSIKLIKGSCADQEVDAVVNAANRGLYAGGGICGVIFNKAGMRELTYECRKHKTPLKDGEAVITSACKMTNCKYIIHAVGPDFSRTKEAFKKYDATRTDNNEMLFVNSENRPATAGNIYEWIKKWGEELTELTGKDYTRLSPHSLRHCYVNNMLDGSHYLCKEMNLRAVPLEKIKTLVHHSSSQTTLSYAQNNEDKDIEDLFGITL